METFWYQLTQVWKMAVKREQREKVRLEHRSQDKVKFKDLICRAKGNWTVIED